MLEYEKLKDVTEENMSKCFSKEVKFTKTEEKIKFNKITLEELGL